MTTATPVRSIFMLALLALAFLPGAALAKRYVVNRTDDPATVDSSRCTGTKASACSLRDALAAADETKNLDTVVFDIDGAIYLTRKLSVTSPVKLDGGPQKTRITITQNYTVTVLEDVFTQQLLPTLQPDYSSRGAILEMSGDRSSVANMIFDGSIIPLPADLEAGVDRIDFGSDGQTDFFLLPLDTDSDGSIDRWPVTAGILVDFPRCEECTFELDNPGSVQIIGNELMNFNSDAISIENSQSAVVADNRISGGGIGQPWAAADGIVMFLAANFLVSRNDVVGFRNGFSTTLGSGGTIIDNRLTGNRTGVEFDFGGAPMTYNKVARNQIVGNHEDGIISLAQSGGRFEDNVISSNGRFGILLVAGSDNNEIVDNQVSHSGGVGIVISGSSDNVVLGNEVAANGSAPDVHGGIVLIDGSSRNSLRFNDSSSNSGFGIVISGSSANTVSDNLTSDNGGSGIALVQASQDNTVENNVASGNLYGLVAGNGVPFPENNVFTGNTLAGNLAVDVLDLDPVCNDTWQDNTFASAYVASGSCAQ